MTENSNKALRPRIAIGFFGITRSLKWTLPSIQKNIIAPARELGETRLFAHFYQQEHINNPRTGENQSLDPNEYQLLECDEVELEKPGNCLARANYDWILSHGDAFKDGGKSLSNLIHQLHSLQEVGRMIDKWEPDVVIMARPDLMYHDCLYVEITKQINRPKSYLSIPNWQWYGGLNDRFAIGSRESCHAYSERFDLIKSYLEKTGGPLPAERFLRYCLNQQGMIARPMSATASRVRSNGQTQKEIFLPISAGKYLKRSIESRLYFIAKKFRETLLNIP
jgi:hypothetical protein